LKILEREIRDTNAHDSKVRKLWTEKGAVIYVKNTLNQAVTIQVKARTENNEFNVGNPFTIEAGAKHYETFTEVHSFILATAQCSVAPTSGTLTIWLEVT